jgi:hypothetical protein
MRAKRPTANPTLPTKVDNPPETIKTESNEKLLRKIILEAKHFRGPASENHFKTTLRNAPKKRGGHK